MDRQHIFGFRDLGHVDVTAAFIAKVPAGITSVDVLLITLNDVLELPDYFGFNWNALSDCLRDLHWIRAHDVILVHLDVPLIPETDLVAYLDVLAEAVESWGPEEEHRLQVIFPENTRGRVLQALATPGP